MYANNTLLCYVYKRHIHGFIKYDILDSQMMVRSQSAASLSVFHQTQKLQTGGRFMVANQLALSHESQRLWSQEEFKNNSVGHRFLLFTSTNRLTATSTSPDLISRVWQQRRMSRVHHLLHPWPRPPGASHYGCRLRRGTGTWPFWNICKLHAGQTFAYYRKLDNHLIVYI